MDYMQQNVFAFASQPQPQFLYQPVQYPTFMTHSRQPVDDFYMTYNGAEYADFMDAGMMHDEFGETQEISTRPRLTKEQAEILEAHFQANHKPSSQLKRELAIQTNLKLTRVGNWFQNRRAKAKQQKRQEEYEAQHAAAKTGSNEPRGLDLAEDSALEPTSPRSSVASPTKKTSRNSTLVTISTGQTPTSPVKVVENSKEASWNSLQRALGQAKAAQGQQTAQAQATMSSLEIPPQNAAMQLPLRLYGHQPTSSTSSLPTWPNQPPGTVPYPSPITLQDTSFDFGFDDEVPEQNSSQDPTTINTVVDYGQDSFVVTPEEFGEPLATPKGIPSHQSPLTTLPSPGLTMPSYPGSRRPSTTEDLSTNFSNFALASSSPNLLANRRASEVICPPPSGPLDIAARRKRPRPAALTSASLRSRSYGALTSASPTFRQGLMSPQGPHSVRHVKSAGQSLHSRYAGIRKASSAQRSPMCASTFAEGEALNRLMAQQAIATTPLGELPEPLLSSGHVSSGYMLDPEKNHPFFAQAIDMPSQYTMRPPQNLSITPGSPPVTPMMAAFMSRAQSQQSLIPPASAPPQFAAFTDYTPPYSAGPLTNSSWSDAPLTSPEISSFPVTQFPSLGFPRQCDGLNGQFQQYVLPSDNISEVDFVSHVDKKKTEFCIQEFPNQKEELAHVAQQLAQQRPKNYVFANTAPQDYTNT